MWGRSSKDMTAMPPLRHRGAAKKPMWIIVLLSLVCVALMGAYVYPPRRYSACYFFASSVCTPFKDWLPAVARERTDEEIVSSVVIRDLLSMPMAVSKNPKIAFMFLTPGTLPFEKLWEKFLQVWSLTLIYPSSNFGVHKYEVCIMSSVSSPFCNSLLVCSKFIAQGHDGRYSIYIHASREKPVHSSSLFVGREIHSEKVTPSHPFTSALVYLSVNM